MQPRTLVMLSAAISPISISSRSIWWVCLCSLIILEGMCGKVVSTCLPKPCAKICQPHLIFLAFGIMLSSIALSICRNSGWSPSVMITLMFNGIYVGIRLGDTTEMIYQNIHDYWLGMKTRRKINILPWESFPP